jgi:hypothetical protein
VQRRRESRRGDKDDDERRRGAKHRTTPHTRDRGEPEREAVPQLDPRACWRDGNEEGDNDERRRGAKRRWIEPNAGDLDWILSDSDEGASSGKEERAGEGAVKLARGLPHVCEHKCLATMKRCRGRGEKGVEDLISDSGNDHDDGEASFYESHCLFTCSIDGA